MRLDDPKRLVRWGLGALMLLLVHELCAPRAARAGCSHLVVSQSARLFGLDRLDAFILGGTSSMVSDDSVQHSFEQQDRTRRLPCSGPSCSDHVPSPVRAASQESGGSDQWGSLNSFFCPEIFSPSDRTTDEPVLRPMGKKLSIFHPPPA
jgi:hypothetical protein